MYATAFRQIRENKVQNLIIDLRGNGGGIGSNAAHLLQYLVTEPFTPTTELSLNGNDQYYRSITKDSMDLDRYFQLQQAANGKYLVTNREKFVELKEFVPLKTFSFNGSVYVLIDGGSLSAAGTAAGLLREYTRAIFIGQQTGGYGGISNGIRQVSISGDSTDVAINLPLIHGEFSVHERLKTRGITPDYWVENSIHDIINGKDAVLEFVLEKIQAK